MSDVTIVSTTADVTVLSVNREVTFVQVGVQGPAGPSAHGELSGLDDDDHPQYHNNARGDARYAPLAHAYDTDNPHEVTSAQVGADASGTAASAVSAHAGGTGVHDISGVTGLQTVLDGKSPTSHDHSSGNGVPVAYANLSGKPTLGTAAALDVGTTANKVVQLDGAAKLPAIDGSQLTHLPSVGVITIHDQLSGLASDDHLQYHTDGRGDARYSPLAHASNTSNPHSVTAGQVGADASGTASAAVSAHAGGSSVHAIASVTGLQTALDGKSPTSHNHDVTYAPIVKGVTNGDTHDHNGGDGAQIAYSTLSGLPTLGSAAATNTTAYEAAGGIATHAALTTTHGISAYGATLVDDTSASVARTTLGLGNVDNTSDANKPVSTAQASADTAIYSLSKGYALSRSEGILTNGFGNLADNTNFSAYTFDPVDTYSGKGSFRVNTTLQLKTSDEFVPVNINTRYSISLYAKSGDIGGGTYNASNVQSLGIVLYDIDLLPIDPYYANKHIGSTDTTLAVALNPGDTTVTLTNATGWYNGSNILYQFFSWYGWTNSYGYVYPDYTYSRYNSINYSSNSTLGTWGAGAISGNVITLRVPWAGPSIASGAAIRNCYATGTYKYVLLSAAAIPNTWTRYEGYIGPGTPSDSSENINLFRAGTAFIKLLHLANWHGAADNNVRLSGLSINQISCANLESRVGIGATYKKAALTALPTNGIAVEGKIGAGTLAPAAIVSGYGTTEQARWSYDSTTYVGTLVSSTGRVTKTLAGTAAEIKWIYSDATTNDIYALATFSKNTSGTGAAGLGLSITLAAKSSTTVDSPQVTLTSSWVVATHATRTARGTLNAIDYNATREAIRWEADGAAVRLGFFGATSVVKPTSLTATVAAAPAGGTGTAAGAWDTSGNRDLAIATINNLKTRVDQLESKLQALGLLT